MEQTRETQLAQLYDVLGFRRVITRYDVVSRVCETGPCALCCYCSSLAVPVSYGPLARDVDSLAIAMKALTVDSTLYEVATALPPVPFRSEVMLCCFSFVSVELLHHKHKNVTRNTLEDR